MTLDGSPAPGSGMGALISVHAADRASARRSALVLGFGVLVFVALAPFAKLKLPQQPIFMPVVQTILIVNDLVTALLLFAQAHVTRGRAITAVACGYAFAALMAMVHLLSFPGVFAPAGLLGGNQQTTGYLYVFWHAGFAAALLRYAYLRHQDRDTGTFRPASAARSVGTMLAAAALLAAFATRGSAWLPPMLDGNTYSSVFNIGRYGQWVLTAIAIVAIWRIRTRTVLDVWLLVVLGNYFIEIGLVGIFNAGRYDLGFYAGRIFALLASCWVLGVLLLEQARLYAQLVSAQETARSELQLREGREALRRALLAGGMGAWSADLATGRVWWSVELEEAAGYAPGSFAGTRQACLRHVHPDDLPALRRASRRALVDGGDFAVECRFRAAGGEWRWISGRGRAETGADGRPVKLFGSVMDISERKRAEAAAIELESSLRNVADHLPVLAWMARPDGSVTWCNRLWHEYTGMARCRDPDRGWQSVAHPDGLPEIAAGRAHSLASGQPFEQVVHWRGADGSYRPFLTRCVALRDGDGAIIRWLGTSTDISEQHSTELALRTADRHKDVFLATLAYELRTPLAPIRHAVELLRRMPDLPSDADRMRHVIDRQSLQLLRLVEDLMDAARIAQGKLEIRKERTSLSTALADAVDAVRPLCDTCGHEIFLLLGDEDLQLMADPGRLRQLFVNLLNNAARFTPQGGRISVRALRDGPRLRVSVQDTGIGVDPAHLGQIFDLFSHPHREGTERRRGGSGIGLALAKGIVAAHGGSISVVSAGTGSGTEMTVDLPVDSTISSSEIQIPGAGLRPPRNRTPAQ